MMTKGLQRARAGKPSIVSIVKSRTLTYDEVDFNGMVVEAVKNIEDAGVPIPSSGTVFIKPNLLLSATARESITTEPRFLVALIRLLKNRGISTVYVGDSSASFAGSNEALKFTGMGDAVREAGGVIVNIDDPVERTMVPLPESDIVHQISLPEKALDADCLINFAKLKTHRLGAMTATVKNWVGMIEQSTRLKFHQSRLPKLVSEIHSVLPEQLCFTDAVVVGEGERAGSFGAAVFRSFAGVPTILLPVIL